MRTKLGIVGIYRRGDERNDEILLRIKNSRNIKIMAISAESLIRHCRNAIINALVENNCHVQVLIASPRSVFVREVETLEGPEREDQISREIEHTETRLEEIRRLANERAIKRDQPFMGLISVSFYNSALRGSLIICDNIWGWYTPNLHPKRAIESISLEITTKKMGLLDDCISHFDTVWNTYRYGVKEIK